MPFLTKAKFAAAAGVSRQHIYKMCEERQLTVRPDGKLDTDDPTNRNYLTKKNNENKYSRPAVPEKKPEPDLSRPEPIQESGENPVVKIKPEKKQEKQNGKNYKEPEDVPDKYKLQCEKLEMDIQKLKIITDEMRGKTISRSLVERLFGELYQIDINEFLQLSSSLTARICQNIFKIDKPEILASVSKTIDEELFKTQKHIKKKIDKFLNEIKKEFTDEQN